MIRFLIALLIAANYLAAAGLSAKIEYKSDYIFRGVTQTNHEGALQGALRYGFESGFYLGAFGSNVYDAKDDAAKAIQYDFSSGYLGEAGDIWFEAGAISRNFTIDDANYIEALFAVGYGAFRLAGYDVVAADNDYFEGDRYVEASANFSEVLGLIDIGFGAGYGLPSDRDVDSPLNLFASLGKTLGQTLKIGASAEIYSDNAKDFGKTRFAVFIGCAF
ncbi:MAG: TorF family putative porin [Helicobacteraceae bacterium]|nr:TorF family putative porin [Helicobacteraceae bacterium]